ncbi:MAG TPA: CPBP family intramembrane glutamic endopeptidase [Candidatus Dormibacteraeota bacterium]
MVLVNLAQAGGSRRPGLRTAGEAVILVLPGLVVLFGVLDGLGAAAGRAEPGAVAYGFGVALAGALAGAAGTPMVVSALASRLPIDPDNLVHRLALVLTVGLVALQAVTQLTTDVLGAEAAGAPLTRLDLVVQEVPFLLAALVGVGLWTRRSPAGTVARLGLAVPRPWQLVVALAAAGAFYAFGVGADALDHWLTPALAQRVNAANLRIFGGLSDPVGIATIALAAGICEEVFFRGALQPRLGLFWPAMVFASVHTQYGLSLDALAVLVLALGLGLLRRFTNTTTTALCHVAYNGLVGAGIGWLGLPQAVLVEVVLLLGAILTTWVGKRGGRN